MQGSLVGVGHGTVHQRHDVLDTHHKARTQSCADQLETTPLQMVRVWLGRCRDWPMMLIHFGSENHGFLRCLLELGCKRVSSLGV
jgi:hypothetical protein